ncbi:MAG: trypsin-like peptidase domain-containing protein [Leptolyngbyaceae cyanobacterium]
MAQNLEALLQECTVKLTLANGEVGTGFFVAPGYVLTCEHVVRNAGDEPISLRWQQDPEFAQAQIEQLLPAYDLALLRFTPPREAHPCVMLDADIQRRDELDLFGYPERDYPDGRPAGFVCEGEFQEADLSLILLKQGQMQPGMSGAALLNGRTGKVCAMAKLTRDQYTDLGGGGIKASVILEQLPALIEWQQTFHQRDRRWQNLLSQVNTLPTCPNNLPRSGAVAFVGRESELADLHRQLHQADRLAITAIQGMGGIGKTELALQYAQHHRDQNTYLGGICWLQAKDQNVGTEIVNVATDYLQLTVPTDIDLPRQAQFCWSQWPGAGEVLVVIDDVGGPDDIAAYTAIQPYLPPQSSRFWVLLTTRLQLGASIRSLQIEVLS